MRLLALTALASIMPVRAYAVVWERQAERLQKVSAALLDTAPVPEPVVSGFGVGLGLNISFLPTINNTVGGKREKVPSAPIQTIPSLSMEGQVYSQQNFSLGLRFAVGYLPPGGEKLFNIKAKLNQNLLKFEVIPALNVEMFKFFVPIGMQQTYSELNGAITAPDTSDTFVSRTRLIYAAPSVSVPLIGIWASVLLAARRNDSRLIISSDETDFKLRDRLGDARWPLLTQFTVGFEPIEQLRVSLSEQWTPARLLMPRLGISYTYQFLDAPLSGGAKP